MSIYSPDPHDPFIVSIREMIATQDFEIPEDATLSGLSWDPAINKGRIRTLEERQKISEGAKGRIQSDETKSKISASLKGKANKKGYKLTQEQKDRIAASRRGKKFPRNKT